jgi:F-type H+-transporting ATPase subunit alpha
MEVLKQKQYAPYSLSRQVVELYAAKNRYLDDLEVKEIHPFLERLYSSISNKHPEILKTIDETKALGPELSASLKAAVEEFKGSYSA